MKEWLKVSFVLCSFGFFREFRPSEPFITEFLQGEWRNITSDQINRDIYPLGTYLYLAQLVIVFLVTDFLRYKPIIILSACVGLLLWSLLLWTTSLRALQLVQGCYGFFMAAEVAYYTYMYAKVDKDKYQKVTGHARAAILSGRFLASVLAQFLYSFDIMDARQLNYISLGAQGLSLIVSILLPSVGVSLYFYAKANNTKPVVNVEIEKSQFQQTISNNSNQSSQILKPKLSCSRAGILLWKHFLQAYSTPIILQWSIWWALSMGGFLQVQSYVQLLWSEIDPNQTNNFNGAVEAALTFLGVWSAFGAGFLISKTFHKFDLWILTLCSLLEGIIIIISSRTTSIWIAYSMYILFGVLYTFMITMASATVANNLADDSFALIFGINTLIALVFQTLLTVVFVSETGFKLTTRDQYMVFGLYFVALATICLIASLVKLIFYHRQKLFMVSAAQ